jgi:hypothetical protein
MLYSFFWVIPPASELFMPTFRKTEFHLHRRCKLTLPMNMEQTKRFETSAYKIQTPGNHPKERIQHLNILSKMVPVVRSYMEDIKIPEKKSQICIFLCNGRHVYYAFFFILTSFCNILRNYERVLKSNDY